MVRVGMAGACPLLLLLASLPPSVSLGVGLSLLQPQPAWQQPAGAVEGGTGTGEGACALAPPAASQLAETLPSVCAVVPSDDAAALGVLRRLTCGGFEGAQLSLGVLASRAVDAEYVAAFRAPALRQAGVCRTDGVSLAFLDGAPFRAGHKNRFPYNALRNLAASACTADFVLVLDGDFEVLPRGREQAEALQRAMSLAAAKTVVVLPSFGLMPGEEKRQLAMLAHGGGHITTARRASSVPADALFSSKAVLLRSWREASSPSEQRMAPFQSWKYRPGVLGTNNARWSTAFAPYEVQHTIGWEPYLLMPRADMIAFDASFAGYGGDKISFVHELALRGRRFLVSHELYVVHTALHDRRGAGAGAAAEQCQPGPHGERQGWQAHYIGNSCWDSFLQRMNATVGRAFLRHHEGSQLQKRLLREAERAGKCYGGACATDGMHMPPPAARLLVGEDVLVQLPGFERGTEVAWPGAATIAKCGA